MEQQPTIRLKCRSIPYRQGFIEVTPGIHKGHVNIETWHLQPEVNLNDVSWVDEPSISDSAVVANCEIELTQAEARNLADAIESSLKKLSQASQ